MNSCCLIERTGQNVFQVTIKGRFSVSHGSELRKSLERMLGENVQVILQNVSLPHHIDFHGLANLVDGLRLRQLRLIQAQHSQESTFIRTVLESDLARKLFQAVDEDGTYTH